MKKLASVLTLLASFSALAQTVYDDQFQTIQNIELVELVETLEGEEVEHVIESKRVPTDLEVMFSRSTVKSNIPGAILVIKELIALGKEVYKIVDAGRPVSTVNSEPVQILPKDEQGNLVEAIELTSWKAPIVRKYRVRAKNYLGTTPASFDFMLIYSYGGKYMGKGAYITAAQIKPTKVNVSWGYNLDATFKVQSILNQGTAESPIAGAVLMIDYRIKTVLRDSSSTVTYFINGLGQTTTY